MFFHFGQKFKMAAICGEGKSFGNCQEYIAQIPCGSKLSTKSLYLAWLRRYKQFCVLPFLGRGKFFENCQEYIDQIPCCLIISDG